eukprot:6842520-Alexandrium_andersonii.AAC.1
MVASLVRNPYRARRNTAAAAAARRRPSNVAGGEQIGLPRRGRAWEPVSYTHLTLPTICSV